jgi:hypothetical protein
MTVYRVSQDAGTCNPREDIWPNGTEVQEQLFGNLEELYQMAVFIAVAGSTVHLRMQKKKTEVIVEDCDATHVTL